jgi:hypothetical protein
MRIRDCAGAINRAHSVMVWVWLDPGPDGERPDDQAGMWVEVSKVSAKKILEHCRANGIDEINAEVVGKNLHIDCMSYDAEEEPGAEAEETEGDEEESSCGPDCPCKEHDGLECLEDDCPCDGHDD